MKKTKSIQHIELSNIQNPDFLKELNKKEVSLLCSDIRNKIIEVTSKNGGHLSSNLGSIESTVALCKTFDFKKDKIIFDVGHQCYTYKILTGRSLERIRLKNGPSGFQRMAESPFDHYEAGHSSTSIAAANGMAIVRDIKKEKYNIIAYIGDSSVANGLALEALNDGDALKHKIIIVLNDNDMSISKPVGGLSKAFRRIGASGFYINGKKAFNKMFNWNPFGRWFVRILGKFKNCFKIRMRVNVFDTTGYSYIGPVDGHNVKAMEKAFKRASELKKSVIVHLKTVKGYGYEPAENDRTGSWHGVNPFDIKTGKPLDEKKNQWAEIYSRLLLEQMRKNKKIITIVPGTSLGSYIDTIHSEFPNRTIDVGIAEEYATTLASGVAVSGCHPVVSMYSTFLQRAYDEISHDLARIGLNATFLIDRAGLVGQDGNSHQGIFDEAFLYTIPNTVICMASNPNQSASLLKESFNNHGVFCIRYSKDVTREYTKIEEVAFGKWKKELNPNSKVAVVSVGPETEKLKEIIKDKNVKLFNAIYQKPLDTDSIKELLKLNKVIIFDPYGVEEGFPSALATTLLKCDYKGKLIIKAIPSKFIQHSLVEEQLADLNITIEDVIKLI